MAIIKNTQQIDAEDYDNLLGALYPANYFSKEGFTCFMVNELVDGSLYTWCATDNNKTFWKMLSPSDTPAEDIIYRVKLMAAR